MFLSKEVIEKCRMKLIHTKEELLTRYRESLLENATREVSGDEGDQTQSAIEEHNFLVAQQRLRTQLMEIESALARIQKGTFGICEETEETIETDRLMAIPWTRLSIEGAELRETVEKRYAK